MARTIDERIVQMTFNNQEFEERAKATISTLGKLKNATDAISSGDWLGDIGKSIANSGLQSLTVTTTKISEGFSALEQIAVGALRKIGETAIVTGTNLLKALTVNPFKISWSKYDEGIAAEQAIMSAVEGKLDANGVAYDMDQVVERVDKLKWYADETSYSITQMTNAVGQFTAAGQDLDMSVTAVMGIANACADAGVSTQKAESAFIGFSKAIGSGTLTLGTWNMQLKTSGITNSERFRKTLLDQAAAAGTLKKTLDAAGNAVYSYGGKVVNTANFTEFLNKGIITSEVLINTLNKYADTTEMVREIQSGNLEALTDLYNKSGKEMSDTTKQWVKELEDDGKTASEVITELSRIYKEELGEDIPASLSALRRAQEAISWSQALEATAEAMTSQFSNIYHIMVGNYEEAKQLWSSVADEMNAWFVGPLYDLVDVFGYVRNAWDDLSWDENSLGEKPVTQILAIWKEFAEVINNVLSFLGSLSDEVFGKFKVKGAAASVFNFLESIRSLLKDINQSFEVEKIVASTRDFANSLNDITGKAHSNHTIITNIGRSIEGLLKVFRAIITIGKEFNSSFISPLIDRLKPIVLDILEIFGNIGDILSSISDNTISDLSPLQKILNGILDVLDPIIDGIASFVGWIKELTSQNGEITIFSGLFETIGNVFEFIGKAVKGSVNLFSSVSKGLTDIFANIKGVLGNFLESKGTDVSKLAEGGFLAYLAVGLTKAVNKLKKLDIQKVLEGITKFFTGNGESKGLIGTIKETFETLTNSIKTFTESVKVKMLEIISSSLLKLAAALLIISLVNSDKIANSLGAMAGMLTEVVIALAAMNQINAGKGFNKTALAFDQIAGGLVVMAIALKIISSTQPDQMVKALGVLGIALLEVYIFMAGLNSLDPKVITNSAKAFKKISTGLLMMSVALKVLSSINPERMTSTLVLLGVSLAELFAFLVLTSNAIKDASGNKMVALGKALTNMGVGLIALSVALKIMSTINTEQMSQALMGLILSLAALGLFVAVMSNSVGAGGFVAIAAGMLILSTALIALGAALGIMGSLKLATIGKGLLTLAGALVVIGLGAAIIGPISPLLLLLSVAIGAFGLALSAAAKGIIEFMAAYTLMSAMGPNFVSSLIDVFDQAISAIVAIIPTFIVGIVDGILMSITMIKDRIFAIIQLIFEIAVDGFMTLIGPIIDVIKRVIIEIINALDEILPHLIDLCYHFVSYMIQAANENLPDLVNGLFVFLTTTINSLAETIKNKGGEFGTAVGNLASAIVTGIADALVSAIGSFGMGLIEGGKSLWDKVVGFFSGEEAQEGNVNAGYETLSGVEEGVLQKEPELLTTVDTVGTAMTDEMDRKDDAKVSANNTTDGFINQISARLSDFFKSGEEAGSYWMSGFTSTGALYTNSPSKATAKVAEYAIQGFIGTIKDNTSEITGSGTDLGSTFVDALSNSIRIAEDLLDDDMNPVITPVLDLSNIENNTGAISDLLGANASLNGAMNISGSALANLQNGVLSGGNTITMYNTFELNGVQDMDRAHARSLAEMLYDEMNTLLGNQV